MAVTFKHQGCPRCGHKMPLELLRWGSMLTCAVCHAPFQGEIFPALFREPEQGRKAESLGNDQEASCFFHLDNRAVHSCSTCGRFVCALCALELPSGVVCPGCFGDEKMVAKAAPVLEKSRRIWSSVAAWLLGLSCIFFWPLTIGTAPVACGLAIYGMRQPGSLTGRGRWKNVVVLIVGLMVVAAWAWGILSSNVWTWLE